MSTICCIQASGIRLAGRAGLDMRSSWNHATGQVWRQLMGAANGTPIAQ